MLTGPEARLPQETGLHAALRALTSVPHIARNITYVHRVSARPARFAEFPEELDSRLAAALRARGFERFYTHQAQAVRASLAGRDIVVVTPTASGKTLCFNVPVVQQILAQPSSRALYLFPTKALAQDQYNELHELTQAAGRSIKVYTFDGDTPSAARRAIRVAGNIVLTNPDMLHTGILPNHTGWIKLFENLKHIVIDEVHHYRGVFGSHLANVLRRLERVCAFYGSHPRFICCSATIANPGEIAEKLTGRPFMQINDNGAPAGEKYFIFYNPPVVNAELGIRRGVVNETRRVAARFLAAEAQTIIFARSRMRVEILLNYLKKTMVRLHRNPERIAGYRGGYLPNERRAIEQGVKSGAILGVVSTNALELGIDIGQLRASILAGYPGSVSSMWQQAGRAGRKAETSVVVLIGSSSPLDQFVVTHPGYFFGSAPESAIVNPNNAAILANHIKCASFELPFEDGEVFGDINPLPVLQYLGDQRVLRHTGEKWYWSSDTYPSENISLRSAGAGNFVVLNVADKNRLLAEVDYDSAPFLIHKEAIYMHMSQPYFIENLDWERRTAYARPQMTDYYTDALAKTDIRVLQSDLCEWFADAHARPDAPEENPPPEEPETVPGRLYPEIKPQPARPEIKPQPARPDIKPGPSPQPEIQPPGPPHIVPDPDTPLAALDSDTPLARLGDEEEFPLARQRDSAPAAAHDLPPHGPEVVAQEIESQTERLAAWSSRSAPGKRLNLRISNPLLSRNFGEVVVSTIVAKFKKIRFETHENVGYGDIHVPPLEMQTEAYWMTFLPEAKEQMELAGLDLGAGLAGIATLLSNVVPLFVLCDPRDMVSVAMVKAPHDELPTIYLYDKYPGGIGLARKVYDLDIAILDAALDILSHCGCAAGCPSCAGPDIELTGQSKLSAHVLLEAIQRSRPQRES